MRLSLVPLALLIVACEPEREEVPAVGVWTAPEAATSSRVLAASGTAPVRVAIRAEGSWGAAVPGDVGSITVNGTSETPVTDGGGVAVLTLNEPGLYEIVGANTVEVPVFAADSGLDMMPRHLAQDEILIAHAASGGAIIQSDSMIWWVPSTGEPMSVLDVSGQRLLAGSAVGDVDSDGRTDVLTWSGNTVAVLRSHPTAGHVLAGTIVGEGRVAVGAALDDVNGDGLADIVITWSESPRFELEVWAGDGEYGFVHERTIRLRSEPFSVSVGDNTGDGLPQITVLDNTGVWARFVASLNTYAQTGPQLDISGFVDHSTSRSGNYFGDDAQEIFIVGPPVIGVGRDIRMFEFTGDFRITFFELGTVGATMDLADSNRDGRDDVWLGQEDGEIFLRRYVNEAAEQRRVWTAPDPGPIAVRDHNGDRIPELFVAGASYWDFAPGGQSEFDGNVWWGPSETEMVFELGFTTVPVITRINTGNSRIDIIGTSEAGTAIDLVVAGLFPGAEPLVSELSTTSVSTDGADAVDVAVCGGLAVVLTTTEVVVIDVGATVPVVLGRADTTGTQVACGSGPNSSDVGVLEGTTVHLFSNAGADLGTETVVAGAVDLALADGDVAVCVEEGCGVVALSNGSMASTGAGEIRVGDDVLVGGGQLVVLDIDQDGDDEVLASDGGSLTLLEQADGQWVARERGYTGLQTDGPVFPGDVFADGRFVLLGSRNGDLVVSTGTVLVPEPVVE